MNHRDDILWRNRILRGDAEAAATFFVRVTDGRYSVPGLPPGDYAIYVGEAAAWELVRQARVEVGVGSQRFDFVVGGGSIEGQVRAEAASGLEEPLPRAVVVLARVRSQEPDEFIAKGMADGEGRYRFDRLREGLYRVSAYDASGRSGNGVRGGPALPGDGELAGIDLVLRPGGHARIVVEDAGGSPVRGAVIGITGLDGEGVQDAYRMLTGAEGSYRLRNLRVGPYAVTVRHPEVGAGEAAFEIRAGEETTVPVVRPHDAGEPR